MPKTSFAFAVLLALSGGVALASGGAAEAAGWSRPARACAPFAGDLRTPGLWLGHFTGGRLIRATDGDGRTLDWRDDYSCFPTGAACAAWQRGLRRRYRAVQGYRTCTPLRGGGVRIRPFRNVVTAKY